MRRLLSLWLAGALVLAFAGTTLAAKGGGGGGAGTGGATVNSITLLGPAGAAPTSFAFGATVGTYSTYDSTLTQVSARVTCLANSSTVPSYAVGTLIYDQMVPLQQGTWSAGGYAYFSTTASNGWMAGGADCTGALMTYAWKGQARNWSTLATVSFPVAP